MQKRVDMSTYFYLICSFIWFQEDECNVALFSAN